MNVIRKLPDAEIVANLRSGERMDETIRALYHDHFETMSRYVIANSGSEQDAEDIFQDLMVSFIELVQKDKFRGESSIGTFLFSMNRFAWLNELKRRGRAEAREEKFEKMQENTREDMSDLIVKREERQVIGQLLFSLGESCRKILLLYYYENRSMREILAATDFENEQVVRNKKYKCLKQLERMISEKPELKQTLINMIHG